MNPLNTPRRPLLALAALLLPLAAAQAQPVATEAIDNATIQPAGPRTGSAGTNFFNIEAGSFGSFASYAVARFDLAAARAALDARHGSGGWVLQAVDLQLTQANAAFTADGLVAVGYTADPGPLATSGLRYPADGDFGFVEPLLTYAFAEVATGHVETHRLWQQGAQAAPLMVQQVAAGQNLLALVFTEADAGVAATYAGYSNGSWAGPTLLLHAAAVPEPGTVLLLALGLGALVSAGARRKERA